MTRAVILAAGQGSRLLPHTADRPKCLVELAGRPLLAGQLSVLKGAGIDDITVVGGYRAEQLGQWHDRVVLNPRYEQTNMVHSLFCAAALFDGTDDMLIAYSDILYEPRVLQALLAARRDVAVAVNTDWRRLWELRMDDPLSDAESLAIEDGRIRDIGRKASRYSQIEGQYMGLIAVPAARAGAFRAAWEDLGAAAETMQMTAFLQHLIDRGWPVAAVQVSGGWLEVDTVEDLALYQQLHRSGDLSAICELSRKPGRGTQ